MIPLGSATPQHSEIPTKIVSLTPNLTEILFALGAGDRVVGVTRNDSYPPQVRSLRKVGDMEVDWESLIRLRPDLTVIDSQLSPDHVARLRQLGLAVRVYRSQSLQGMREAVTGLACELNLPSQGQSLLASLDKSLAQARRRWLSWPRRPSVFVEIWWEPLMSAGNQTYVDEMLQAAGGDNVCSSWRNEYPSISTEKLLELDPEVIVLITVDAQTARARPGWSHLRAVRRGHVYRIDQDLMVRPTLRAPEAISQLQGWFESAVQEAKAEPQARPTGVTEGP